MEDERKTYDPNFKYDVAAQPGGEQIKVCYSCGTCTAGCPVTEVDERYSPRKIIRQVLLGQREAVLSNELLWYCETCYACSAYCPQNVKFGDVMRALREMAVAEGYWTPEFLQRVRNVDAWPTISAWIWCAPPSIRARRRSPRPSPKRAT